jgi:hypothetical protein
VGVKIKKKTTVVRHNAVVIRKGASATDALQNAVRAEYIVDSAVGATSEGILKLSGIVSSGNGHEVVEATVMEKLG